jgi:hypothetical protein
MLSTTAWIILGVANLPLYFAIAWTLFADREEFLEALRLLVTPDIISMFRGEYLEDRWATVKLVLWVGASAACVFGEACLIDKMFG